MHTIDPIMRGTYGLPVGPMPRITASAFANSIVTYILQVPDGDDFLDWGVGTFVLRFEGVLNAVRMRYRNVRIGFNLLRRSGHEFSLDYQRVMYNHRARVALETITERIEMKMAAAYPDDQIVSYQMTILEFTPTAGGGATGGKVFPVPKWISDKRCVTNIRCTADNARTDDQDCFRLSVLHSIHRAEIEAGPKRDFTDRSYYSKWKDELVYLNEGPVFIEDEKLLKKVEDDLGRGIHIFGLDELDGGDLVIPLRISDRAQDTSEKSSDIDLLYLEAPDLPSEELDRDIDAYSWPKAPRKRGHFLVVTDHNLLFQKKPDTAQVGCSTKKSHYCKFCCHHYSSRERLDKHLAGDNAHTALGGRQTRLSLPSRELGQDKIRFKAWEKRNWYPFVLIADTESTLVPTGESLQPGCKSYRTQKHVMNSFCIQYQCAGGYVGPSDPGTPGVCTYTGEDAAAKLVMKLREINKRLCQHFNLNGFVEGFKKKEYKECEQCYHCREQFDVYRPKTKDISFTVDQDTGKYTWNYLGCCHRECARSVTNWKNKRIKVYFHNMKGYDGHILLNEWTKTAESFGESFECIPENGEKFKMFTVSDGSEKMRLEVADSLSILDAGLDKLVSELKYPDDFGPVKAYFDDKFPNDPVLAQKIFEKVTKKGIYPYEYVTDHSVFADKTLPPIEKFYSSLRASSVSPEEYQYAQDLFALCCDSFLDYHMLYLVTDVLLLGCCLSTSRELLHEAHGLDICCYMSLPAFTYDAMLLLTGVTLTVPEDAEVHDFGDTSIRGGLCNSIHRHAESSHNDPDNPLSITYFDANNLYGKAMSKPLPTGESYWLKGDGETLEQLQEYLADLQGVMVEADWHIPKEAHDYLSDLPPLPGPYTVQPEEFSSYHIGNMSEEAAARPTLPRLVLNLHDKKNYKCTLEIALLYQSLGAVCSSISRILIYVRSDYMKQYIEKNTKLRTEAKGNDCAVAFFKKLNNAVFGKSMEQVTRRANVNICTDHPTFRKWSAHATFRRATIINESCVIVTRGYTNIVQSKVMIIGSVLLDHSKEIMYRFFYQALKPYYPRFCKLMYMDTDSMILHLPTDNVYRDFSDPHFKDYMDLSGLVSSPGKEFNNEVNRKVPGFFACETGGERIEEYVSLGPKVYSFRTESSHTMKHKGVDRNLVDKQPFSKMRDRLLHDTDAGQAEFSTLRSKGQVIYTERLLKSWFGKNDTKRYILPDGITTLPYGHYRIEEIESEEPPFKRARNEL